MNYLGVERRNMVMGKISVIVKCVSCGYKKSYTGKEMPICEKCFSPMVAIKAEVKK